MANKENQTGRRPLKRIAIQGGHGAFHEIAAKYYFKDEQIEIIPRDTFRAMLSSLGNNQADYGIMAIENTLAGSILPNYSLLTESGKKVIGEIYMRIRQNLVALPGQQLKDIKAVYSHPMAILQCQTFFENYPDIVLIDSVDTALSAKKIREEGQVGIATIASNLAAEMYNLEVIERSIETNKMNYTRFLIVQLDDGNGNGIAQEDVNKSSIHFALAHQIGSLSKILSILSYYNINLSKVQSMPIVGKDWEYQFYVDVEFDDYVRYRQSLDAIKPFTSGLGILGEYVKGQLIVE